MDCDLCGRYRPSSEIAPRGDTNGGFVMACARCRRPGAGDGRPTTATMLTVERPSLVVKASSRGAEDQ